MSDLWTEASRDHDAELRERRLAVARVKASAIWPFLAAARSKREYVARFTLAADSLRHVVAEVVGDGPEFAPLYDDVVTSFDTDYDTLSTARDTEAVVAALKQAEHSTEGPFKVQVAGTGENVWSENALRHQSEDEAKAYASNLLSRWTGADMARVVSSETPNREPVDPNDPRITHNYRTGSKTAAKEGDKSTCHKDDLPIQFFDGQWMHLSGGPSHNDVYPATPRERAEKQGSKKNDKASDYGFKCSEFDENGSCVHSSHMEKADAGRHKKSSAKTAGPMVNDADLAPLQAEWQRSFDALRQAGLEADADHPIAAAYRAASNAVNHAHRSRDFNIATGQPTASKTAVHLTRVRKTADPLVFEGTDPSGKDVKFHVSEDDAQQLGSVMHGDLAQNMSGVEVDEADIVQGDDPSTDTTMTDARVDKQRQMQGSRHTADGGAQVTDMDSRLAYAHYTIAMMEAGQQPLPQADWEAAGRPEGAEAQGQPVAQPGAPQGAPVMGSLRTTGELRPLHEIARDIHREWSKQGGVHPWAKPYLSAMHSLSSTDDKFGEDGGDGIVAYFLSNARTFKGEAAKGLKEELKGHLQAARARRGSKTAMEGDLGGMAGPSDEAQFGIDGGTVDPAPEVVPPDPLDDVSYESLTEQVAASLRALAGEGDAVPFGEGAAAPHKGSRIDVLRQIVQGHQAQEIDGQLVDAQTANLLVQVHDALSPENQAKFDSVPLQKLVELGWKRAGSRVRYFRTLASNNEPWMQVPPQVTAGMHVNDVYVEKDTNEHWARVGALEDLDDAGLDAELRRVMVQQNDVRQPESHEMLRDWRQKVEQEIARRRTSHTAQTYYFLANEANHIVGGPYPDPEEANMALSGRTDENLHVEAHDDSDDSEGEFASHGSKTAVSEDGTPYGADGDHCPFCGTDWKREHDSDCLWTTDPHRAREIEDRAAEYHARQRPSTPPVPHDPRYPKQGDPGWETFMSASLHGSLGRIACRKCIAGHDPSGGDCAYCDGQGSLDLTLAMVKAADGWDQGLTVEAFNWQPLRQRTAAGEPCSRCKGKGTIEVTSHGDDWRDIPCPDCKGTGTKQSSLIASNLEAFQREADWAAAQQALKANDGKQVKISYNDDTGQRTITGTLTYDGHKLALDGKPLNPAYVIDVQAAGHGDAGQDLEQGRNPKFWDTVMHGNFPSGAFASHTAQGLDVPDWMRQTQDMQQLMQQTQPQPPPAPPGAPAAPAAPSAAPAAAAPDTTPRTTRPRGGKPQSVNQGFASLVMAQDAFLDPPPTHEVYEQKVHDIASDISTANPDISPEAALAIAREAVARYSETVSA